MPPARPARAASRPVQNENDENQSTHLTRAKAAALNVDGSSMPSKGGALQAKKGATQIGQAGAQRKRAALGDVSNVGKPEAAAGKKGAASKTSLVSKAAQPTGVQKNTTRPGSRTALASKDAKAPDTKRTGNGAGAIAAHKRKTTATNASALKGESQNDMEDAGPARKKAHTMDAERRIRSESKAESRAESRAESQVVDMRPDLSNVKDLDEDDIDDPFMVVEYANDIFEYLRELELKTLPNPDCMSHQDDLEWKTRGILIDWLIEVQTRFRLLPETLFLCVNIIDRFLSEKVVQLDRLQLVGITALFIASKYEEIASPHVENFKKIAEDSYSEAEILSAERTVLSTLKYDLSYPNPMNFLRRVSKADNYDIHSRTLGKYLMEISLLDHRLMPYPPSQVAAAAMYLSRMMLDRGEWDDTLCYYAGYTEDQLDEVVHLIVDYLARPVVHEAFFKKYASKKFLKSRQWVKKSYPAFEVEDVELSLYQVA